MSSKLFLFLLIVTTASNTLLNVYKKQIINKLSPVEASSISWWFRLFTTPSVILVLLLTLGLFGLGMWMFSLETVNRITAWGWTMSLGAFILTLILTNIFLGETFSFNAGFWLIIISMITGAVGAWLF